MDKISEIASKTLGSSASYAVYTDKFDPSLLNPMPRDLARKGWGIVGDEFAGYDVWHCHEATFLLDSGKPVAGTLKFMYPASSEFMVESKSMKLYLNSFDMCRMGSTEGQAIKNYEEQIRMDLEKIIGTTVSVKFFSPFTTITKTLGSYDETNSLDRIVVDSAPFTDFDGVNNHIQLTEQRSDRSRQMWWTNSLRSRCRHTKQKDTGAAYFNIVHDQRVDPTSLLRQVVSLREVNVFREFCAEKLFVEIDKVVNPAELSVMLLYARRGSLDINPVRFKIDSEGRGGFDNASVGLTDINTLTEKSFGQ